MKITVIVSNEDQAKLVSSVFQSIPDSPFNDVTLVCSDGQMKVNGLTLALFLPNPYRSLPFGEGALLLMPDYKVQEVWKMVEDGAQEQGDKQEDEMKQKQEFHRKQDVEQEKLQLFQCELCFYVFKNEKALKKHADKKHRNIVKDDHKMKENLNNEDKAKLYCYQCNNYFFSMMVLQKHKTNEHEAHDSLNTKTLEVSDQECNSENKLENQINPNQSSPFKNLNDIMEMAHQNVMNQPNKMIEPTFVLEDGSDEVEEIEDISRRSLQRWVDCEQDGRG